MELSRCDNTRLDSAGGSPALCSWVQSHCSSELEQQRSAVRWRHAGQSIRLTQPTTARSTSGTTRQRPSFLAIAKAPTVPRKPIRPFSPRVTR